VVTGQLTALLRQRFGLNSIISDHNRKNRLDHRHHAIDAVVIGLCDRGLIKAIAHESKKHESCDQLNEVTKHVPEPFDNFRDKVKAIINKIIVSHKPEHGTGGALHNETSYGINSNELDRDDGELITRKAIESLTTNEIGKVRDLWLRDKLQNIRDEMLKEKLEEKEFKRAFSKKLAEFGESQTPPIRRVRILKKQEDFIAIKSKKTGKAYRAVIAGENHHMDIIECADGIWRGFAATIFEVNQKRICPKWKTLYPNAKHIMRVHKGDLLKLLDENNNLTIKRVVRINPSASRLYLANHNESGELMKRHDNPDDHFRWDLASISKLKERKCIWLRLNELGKS
jgi:CRISPR-associated endonuclease Csn1